MELIVKNTCPICGGDTVVTEFTCNQCHSTVQGRFSLNKFSKLTDEQMWMVERFLFHRGSLKDLGHEMGISYPTVRNKLEEVVEALGYRPKADGDDASREEILNKLRDKEITADEAVELLRGKP